MHKLEQPAVNSLQFEQSATRQEKRMEKYKYGAQSHRLGILHTYEAKPNTTYFRFGGHVFLHVGIIGIYDIIKWWQSRRLLFQCIIFNFDSPHLELRSILRLIFVS